MPRAVDFLEDAIEHAESFLQSAPKDSSFFTIAQQAQDLLEYRVGIVHPSPEARIGNDDPVFEFGNAARADDVRRHSLGIPAHPHDWPPLVKFAVELILLERAIDRLQSSADRFTHLGASLLDRRIPFPVERMLHEVVELYLWGFDRQAVAAACSCFEHIAREALVALGRATRAQLRRTSPSAEHLRRELVREELLRQSASEVEFLVRSRNAILHDPQSSERLSRSTMERCIGALEASIRELQYVWPSVTPRAFPSENV